MEQGIRQNQKFLEFAILLTGADSNVASAGCLGNKGSSASIPPQLMPIIPWVINCLVSLEGSGFGQKTLTVAFSIWWTYAWKQLRKISAKLCIWFGLKVWVVPTIRVTNATLKSLQVLPITSDQSDFCTLPGNLSQLVNAACSRVGSWRQNP